MVSLSLIAIGCLVGWFFVASDGSLVSSRLAVVTCLLIVQVPLDLLARRLARSPTLLALSALVAIQIVDALEDGKSRYFLSQVTATLLVVSALTLMFWISPRSLGLGDVLLAAPLAVAVSSVSVPSLAIWLLIASCSASIHGVVLRVFAGNRYVPFGPHLLGAAWSVLMVSV